MAAGEKKKISQSAFAWRFQAQYWLLEEHFPMEISILLGLPPSHSELLRLLPGCVWFNEVERLSVILWLIVIKPEFGVNWNDIMTLRVPWLRWQRYPTLWGFSGPSIRWVTSAQQITHRAMLRTYRHFNGWPGVEVEQSKALSKEEAEWGCSLDPSLRNEASMRGLGAVVTWTWCQAPCLVLVRVAAPPPHTCLQPHHYLLDCHPGWRSCAFEASLCSI